MKKVKLSPKKEKFCREYLIDKNYKLASVRSGYEILSQKGNAYYVYGLCDPRSEEIFYIGKGKKNRSKMHISQCINKSSTNHFKNRIINEILKDGSEVLIIYFAINISEIEAFDIERLFIKGIGTNNLSNIQGGGKKNSVMEWAKNKLIELKKLSVLLLENRPVSEIETYLLLVSTLKSISINGEPYEIQSENGKVSHIKFKF